MINNMFDAMNHTCGIVHIGRGCKGMNERTDLINPRNCFDNIAGINNNNNAVFTEYLLHFCVRL